MAAVFCKSCCHFRVRAKIRPFKGVVVWSPKLLEEKRRWDAEQNKLAELEQAHVQAGEPFDYEPHFYPWCAHWSQREVIDPVQGTTSHLYELCQTHNPEGRCEVYLDKADPRCKKAGPR